MTSPELPYIEGGTIWDGVTQYHLQPFLLGKLLGGWICRMYMDGTRRFQRYHFHNQSKQYF